MLDWIVKQVQGIKTFKFLNDFIRRYECIQKYQGVAFDWDADRAWATRGHVTAGVLYGVATGLSGFIHPLFLLTYIAAFLLHSPLMELWFQYDKEKDKYVWNVMAQMFERGIGFAFLLPLPITVLVLGVGFGIKIL